MPQEMTAKAVRQGSRWLEPGWPVRAVALAENGANRTGAAMKEEPPKQLRVRTVGTKLTDRESYSGTMRHMRLTIRLLRETDGRWIADVSELPGVTVYGSTAEEATVKAKTLALRVIAEEIEHGELRPESDTLHFSIAA